MLRRPLGVVLLAVVYILGGLFGVATFFLQLFILFSTYFEISYSMLFGSSIVTVLFSVLLPLSLGIAYIYLGYKLLKGSKYACYISITFVAISLVSSIINTSILGAVLTALILFCLFMPSTRQYFLRKPEVDKTGIYTEREEEAEARANI